MPERTLPNNLESERAVLGAALVNPQALAIAAALLRPEEFFRDAHRRVFEAMWRLGQAGTALDIITLKNELARTGELDDVGGPAYLSALSDGVPRSTNVASYCSIVREKARLRAIIQAANETLASAYDGESAAGTIIDLGMRSLGQAVGTATGGGAVSIGEAVQAYGTSLIGGTMAAKIPSGYADVDVLLEGGFRPKDLVIVAGRPSTGKTSWTLQSAAAMALGGFPGAYFSLEMGQERLSARALSWRARVSSARYERAEATDVEYERLVEAMGHYQDVPLYLHTNVRSVAEIWAWSRRLKDQHGIRVAMVDYLQLLKAPGRAESRQQEVAAISGELKALAKELDLVVVALSQLSRAPDGRKDKRPQLSELRDSGALEQDSDVVILLFRPDMHDDAPELEGIAEVIVAKARDGPTGVTKLAFLKQYAKFEDLAR